MELTTVEARVLGCLIEKAATTPDNYPLTLNALRNACNQTTSRDPVVAYADHEVANALKSLRQKGLTRTVHSPSNRAEKYRHVVPEVLDLDLGETALVAVLLLRGPQTVGELKSRTTRLHAFASTDQVAQVLARLAERSMVAKRPRLPGQKDDRWLQVFTPPPAEAAQPPPDSTVPNGDPYGAATAEFYDLLATAHWDTFGLRLIGILADVDASCGPVVDVGSGTGVGLEYLHAAVPDAEIYAVEPSKAMRTALHTRLATVPALRAITTVDPRAFGQAALPKQASALVASAILGHFDDTERGLLWAYIAASLPPGAPAVVELLPPERPIEISKTRYREVAVGAFTYEGWQAATPIDADHMMWTMTYVVRSGDEQIAEYSVRSRWRCLSIDDVIAEVGGLGLAVQQLTDGVIVITSG